MSMGSKEREAYRMKCKHYGADGNCLSGKRMSADGYTHISLLKAHVQIACTPDCDCARMKRWDKLNKEK